jgi:hypothetical protein
MSTLIPIPPTPAHLAGDALSRVRSRARGRPGDPRLVRPALIAVVGAAALLCLWKLTVNGFPHETLSLR